MSSRWAPKDRIRLIQEMASRSGSESASFFIAYDLGAAYRSAGSGSSKQNKINAALAEAERLRKLDEVLDAAAEHFGVEPGIVDRDVAKDIDDDVEWDNYEEEDHISVNVKKIFVSHAHRDETLVSRFCNALILGGVPRSRIFYTSGPGTGISTGEDLRSRLKDELTDSGLVVELVSESFLDRPVCIMELGGAWVLGIPTFPILIPPLARNDAAKAIGDVIVGSFAPEEAFHRLWDELHDVIVKNLGVALTTAEWNAAGRDFFKELPGLLAP